MDPENIEAAEIEQAPEPQPPVSLDRLKRMFRLSMHATEEANRLSVRDRDYFDGDQLSANVRAKLLEREQPLFFTNKIQPAVNGILGIIDAGQSDPQAFPRNSNARQAADIATKLLRHAADKADYKKVRKDLSGNFVIQGVCAAVVTCHENARGMHQVNVERIRWEDFVFDHMSRESDFADATYMGTAKWMDADTVRARFPEEFEKLGDPFDTEGGYFDAKGDLEARKWWIDTDRKRLRVIDLYHLDERGIWCRSIFCERGLLYFGESEYTDEDGNPVCPIEASSYEIKQDNTRYGLVRNMIPLQDECNTLRGKLLHLVNTRQVRQIDLAAPSASKDTARREAQKPNGAIPFGWDTIPTTDMQQGTVLILQRAESDLDRLAPTPAVLGRITSSSESGRARQMLQQAGYTELARALGRFEALELRIYKQMWLRIQQFYQEPQEIRITANGRAPEFLMINEPVLGPVQQPVGIDPMTGQPIMQTALGVQGMNARPAEMDVDIIISTVPDTVNLEQEVWEKMLELVGTLQISPLDPSFDMILKLSPIPNIDEKIEQIRAMREEAQKATAEQTQQQSAFAQAQAKSEFELKQAKAKKESALADKAFIEAQMMGFQAPEQQPPFAA